MLRYLDNDQNAAGHINENYAREIMELHTMGVGSGYTPEGRAGAGAHPHRRRRRHSARRAEAQAAAASRSTSAPACSSSTPPATTSATRSSSATRSRAAGFGEVEQALDLLAASPATAHHVSSELAAYFVGDAPPPALVDAWRRPSSTATATSPRCCARCSASPEFGASLGRTFKDPVALRGLGGAARL